jgi:glyoxylase-like metal-dependent hydrolase (beta-lactamase superfamily II)
MTEHFLPADRLVLDQNALVINTGDKLILFETGMESVKRNNQMGRLTQNLKAAGIDPKNIDYVVPTHAHIDHIGAVARHRPFQQVRPAHCRLCGLCHSRR